MATTVTEDTVVVHVASAYGDLSRTVKTSPPRDARPSDFPIIDVSGMFSDKLSERQAVADQLREACTGTGFFYIINHRTPDSMIKTLTDAAKDFFHQSIEQKSKLELEHQVEGYCGINKEQINKTESIDMYEKLKIDYRPSMDPASKPNGVLTDKEFPWERAASVPSLERAVTDYFSTQIMLARQLLRAIALALDLPEEYFEAKVAEPQAALAINHYAHGVAGAETAERRGVGSHTDFSLITILWQDDTGGLQVLSPEGEWIHTVPIPGSLVCNVGDMMTMITKGKFVSNIHRAQNEKAPERMSIPFFIGLGPKVEIEVVESCDEPDRVKEKYEGVTAGDWLYKRIMDVKLGKAGKGK